MSGHSKWSTIKRQKEANDKKRAQIFSKLVRSIAVAAREGGSDPETNPKLRLATERASAFNVPKENIERALQRAGGEAIESFTIDAIVHGGVALIIEGTTDNRNRSLSEVRRILTKHGAKTAQEGGARWAFARKGLLRIETPTPDKDTDELVLAAINAGAEDVLEQPDGLEIITPPESLEDVRTKLAAERLPVADAILGWIPQQTVKLKDETSAALRALVEELEDHQDVQAAWTNEAP